MSRRLCTGTNASGTELVIHCQGDMGVCQRIPSLQELRDLLSSAALSEALGISLGSLVSRRPQQYRYCPTPDCGHVYGVSEQAQSYTCTGCFEVICTACYQQHFGMSCADYKDLASGGRAAFEQYKKGMNIKYCPICKTSIQKTYGCNHMECGGCHTHICWACLTTLAGSPSCYKHMTEAHGSFGLD